MTLYQHINLGNQVIVHSGAVIGSDGFGLTNDQGRWVKIPQVGSVIIGDNVEIGANTTIDRGALEDTVIGNGVKLYNQIQIGHNVQIGEHTLIAGCTGVAGSTHIGKHCIIGFLSNQNFLSASYQISGGIIRFPLKSRSFTSSMPMGRGNQSGKISLSNLKPPFVL